MYFNIINIFKLKSFLIKYDITPLYKIKTAYNKFIKI